eukprot:gene16062-17685_t
MRLDGSAPLKKALVYIYLLASVQFAVGSSWGPKRTVICQGGSKIGCEIDDTDFAFILKNHCYAVTCLSECNAVAGKLRQPTKLIQVIRTTYMSEEHRIMDDVFRPVKCRDTRPKLHANQVMNISLNVRLVQILDVDAVGQAIKLNVWTTQEWFNPLFAWEAMTYGNVSLVNIEPSLVWTPVLLLYNNADNSMKSIHTMKTKVIANSSGFNTWFASTSIKASCTINVKYFPFDKQICYLNFGSWTAGINELDIEPFGIQKGLAHYTENSEWQVMKFTVDKEIKAYNCCQHPFAEVVYKLELRRKTLYYIYTMILPASSITALIAIGFCLPPNSGERIALSITTLVSMTVYLNLASKRLPATSENIPLLSMFYFLLLLQISMSVAASTLVLTLFYRQNFLEPMPSMIRYIIVEQLGRMLCGVKLPDKPQKRNKSKRRRKIVRFSDVVTPLLVRYPDPSGYIHRSDGRKPVGNDVGADRTAASPLNGSKISVDDATDSSSDDGKETATCLNGSLFKFHTIHEQVGKQLQSMVTTDVDTLTNRVERKQMRQAEMQEWAYASMVVDRFFLVLFILTLHSVTFVT